MLSALIPSAGRQPAVPLAGQLAHESCVRPGPLVLGTAFLRFPTAAPDRDRRGVTAERGCSSLGGQVISAWLCMSPCRSDHIFTAVSHSVRRMVSEDSRHRSSFVLPSVATPSIHGESQTEQSGEPCLCQVLSLAHGPNDPGKNEEVRLL